jgi:trehalose 6-phosphate phosphatase
VALHYRRAPDLESEVRVFAHNLSVASGLTLQHGKMMTELRVTGGDKGQAIKRLMARAPMSGSTPIFLGDDDTDEPAFAAVAELGGAGILVGDIRQTAARYMLPDVAAVRRWLHRASA